jgi:hypothetical protein
MECKRKGLDGGNMKKLTIVLALILFGSSSSANSQSCDIPNFVKNGAKLRLTFDRISSNIEVAEIDKNACWVKDTEGKWINFNLVNL